MKVCFRCGEQKPLGDFYRHPEMRDGHLGKCKECTKRDVRRHRAVSEGPRRYDRSRYLGDAERRAEIKERSAKNKRANPIKYRAQTALQNAVRDGRIEKPGVCTCCGSTERIVGHHCDYAKPLDVVWLCVRCHARLHHAKSF